MKTTMKKSLALFMSVMMMLVCFAGSAMAADSEPDNASATPRYIACPEGGKHEMVGRGVGFAYVNGEHVFDGQCLQCRNCYLAIVAERNPNWYWVDSLGDYIAYNPGYELNITGTHLYSDRIFHNDSLTDPSDPYVSGMEWI